MLPTAPCMKPVKAAGAWRPRPRLRWRVELSRVTAGVFFAPQQHLYLLLNAIHQSPSKIATVSTRTSHNSSSGTGCFSSYLNKGSASGDTGQWMPPLGPLPHRAQDTHTAHLAQGSVVPRTAAAHTSPFDPLLGTASSRCQSPVREDGGVWVCLQHSPDNGKGQILGNRNTNRPLQEGLVKAVVPGPAQT